MQDPKLQKSPKLRQLGTIAQICRAMSSQLKHISTIGKKLVKQQYILHLSSQYGELRPTSGWDLLASLGHPTTFQWVSRHGSVTARHSIVVVSQTLRRWTEGTTYIRQGGITLGIGPHSNFFMELHDYSRSHCYDRFNAMLPVFTYDRFRRNLVRWCSLTLLSFPIVKLYKIWKSKMAVAAILENRKIAISWPKFDHDHYAIQGHSRSMIFVPIESSYATSY